MPDTAAAEAAGARLFGNFVQIGVVVRDLDQTVLMLTEAFGLGPFRFVTYPTGRTDMQTVYRGQPGEFSHRIAFTELGPIELEIVQPVTGSSTLTEFLAEHGEGLHHLRFNVEDVQEVLDHAAKYGITPSLSGSGLRPGTTWAHLDTSSLVGFVVEIMNTLPGTDGRTPKNLDQS